MDKSKTAFIDIDSQFDFMNPEGKLYVPDSINIIDNLKRLINIARKENIKILGSVDAHKTDDPEMNTVGGPFPLHCIKGEKGQKKIPETKPLNPIYVENREYTEDELEKVVNHKGEIYFEKQSYTVFENPNAEKIFKNYDNFIVFGVATDYCVKSAVIGLLDMKKNVYVIEDAIKPVTEAGGKEAIEQMKKKGAKFIKTQDALKLLK